MKLLLSMNLVSPFAIHVFTSMERVAIVCERAPRELPNKSGQKFVIFSQILQVKNVNGVEVNNLKHLRQLVEDRSKDNFTADEQREAIKQEIPWTEKPLVGKSIQRIPPKLTSKQEKQI